MHVVCIADLHINSKKTPGFEKSRLQKLSEVLLAEPLASGSLYILGDTFDTNNPSLQDIKLFYSFIHSLKPIYNNIIIISGNHDSACFTYLPEVDFKYYHEITYDGNVAFVGWNNLNVISTVKKSNVLFTHARCTIPPFIEEETSFEQLSKKAKLVILGDIHHPVKTHSNIYYTYEPTRNTYTKVQDNSTGYLIVNTVTLEVIRRCPELPYKTKLEFDSMEAFMKVIGDYEDDGNLYKVVIEDYIDKLKPISSANMIFEYNPKVIVEEPIIKEEEELKEIINQRVSISEALLVHTQESYNFSVDVLNKVKARLRG